MTDPPADAPVSPRASTGRRLRLAVLIGFVVLALYETTYALVAPALAPTDADWSAAAVWVKGQHRAEDLVVAAPAWADPVLRQHLGELIPERVAGRLDHRRYARVWEVSQRGEGAPESEDGRMTAERRFGRLRVRLFERPALPVTHDFVEAVAEAQVSRVESSGAVIACPGQAGQHQCPDLPDNFVRRRVLEIGNGLRRALLAPPVGHAVVALEYPRVTLGKELAVAGGLHNVWQRKQGDGTVLLKVLVDGKVLGTLESGNRTGWKVARFDTSARAGQQAAVRFEITSARPHARQFGFAAEARGR